MRKIIFTSHKFEKKIKKSKFKEFKIYVPNYLLAALNVFF